MDYAEIIEPLDKCDHRNDAERVKAEIPVKVIKVDRTSRVDKAERTDVRADKSERTERSVAKSEKKRSSASAVDRETAKAASAPPIPTPAPTAPPSETPAPHAPPTLTPTSTCTITAEPAATTRKKETAVEEMSPSDRPLVHRLKAPPDEQTTPSPPAPLESSGSSDSDTEESGVARIRDAEDRSIKDCYIVIKPLDIAQYLSKGRLPEDSDEAACDEWAPLAPQVPPAHSASGAASAPTDPTQIIESQLALLEEMSSHLAAHRGHADGDDGCASAPAPSASPVVLHDEASVSTLASDGAASAPSDAEPAAPGPKRARVEERLTAAASTSTNSAGAAASTPEDCDKDSVSSSDVAQDGGDSPNKTQPKRKPRKRKRKNDATEHIVFEAHRGPILDVKTVGRHVLAACEDGSVYCYSLKSGKLKRQYSGHRAAVICLAILEREGPEGEDPVPEFLYTGSLDHQLRCFQFKTGELVNHPVNLGKPIQCMDENWGTIFMGTKMGEIAKFYTKSFKLNEDYLRCSKDSILAIKATKEGARKIVIVAARNEPVTIRDANSGLLMRVVGNNLPHTVYSLLLESSLLYCGTKTGKIPVFSFTTGEEVCKYNAGYGVVCMRVYNHLLFAGCYDGNIYIYSTQDKSLITCIPGPGKMLLCLDVVKNRIIAGSKDNKLEAWPLPAGVKNCIRESRHR